jgi:hypothetical protein
MLFRPESRFRGFDEEAFRAFAIQDRDERRRAILSGFHPALQLLSEDLLELLNPLTAVPLHAHLPRLDWPQGYQPFCTWLALSRMAHGYQAGPQLNVGVHGDHVAIRLAWDTSADGFGRFEFLCRHGGLGGDLADVATAAGLAFRVYASARWPEGSHLVFESREDWPGAFDEVKRRGVWFELGVRHELPETIDLVTSPAIGAEASRVLVALLPLYDRIAGAPG